MIKPILNAEETIGDFLILLNQKPYYEYIEKEGKKVKGKNIEGYSYECVAMDRRYEKINVKVEGQIPLYRDEKSIPENCVVEFENLQGTTYVSGNNNFNYVACSFKADAIKEVQE